MKFLITLLTGILVSSFSYASTNSISSSSESSISSEDTGSVFYRKISIPPKK